MERSCVYPCLQQSLGRGPPTNRKVVVERTTTLCTYCEPQNDGYRHAKRARMKYCCEVPLYFILQAVPIKSVFPNIKYHQIMFSHQFFPACFVFFPVDSTSFPTWVFRRGHGLGDHSMITVLPTEAWLSKQRGQVWYGRYLHFFILKSSRKSWMFKKFMGIFCDTWSPQKST